MTFSCNYRLDEDFPANCLLSIWILTFSHNFVAHMILGLGWLPKYCAFCAMPPLFHLDLLYFSVFFQFFAVFALFSACFSWIAFGQENVFANLARFECQIQLLLAGHERYSLIILIFSFFFCFRFSVFWPTRVQIYLKNFCRYLPASGHEKQPKSRW